MTEGTSVGAMNVAYLSLTPLAISRLAGSGCFDRRVNAPRPIFYIAGSEWGRTARGLLVLCNSRQHHFSDADYKNVIAGKRIVALDFSRMIAVSLYALSINDQSLGIRLAAILSKLALTS